MKLSKLKQLIDEWNEVCREVDSDPEVKFNDYEKFLYISEVKYIKDPKYNKSTDLIICLNKQEIEDE